MDETFPTFSTLRRDIKDVRRATSSTILKRYPLIRTWEFILWICGVLTAIRWSVQKERAVIPKDVWNVTGKSLKGGGQGSILLRENHFGQNVNTLGNIKGGIVYEYSKTCQRIQKVLFK